MTSLFIMNGGCTFLNSRFRKKSRPYEANARLRSTPSLVKKYPLWPTILAPNIILVEKITFWMMKVITHPDPNPLRQDEGGLHDAAWYPSSSQTQRLDQRDAMCAVLHCRPIQLNKTSMIRPYDGLTSVWLTGTPFPTIFPTVHVFCRMSTSNSFVFLRFSSTCASSSFLEATRSSAFSFACVDDLMDRSIKSLSITRLLLLPDLLLQRIYLLAQLTTLIVHCNTLNLSYKI